MGFLVLMFMYTGMLVCVFRGNTAEFTTPPHFGEVGYGDLLLPCCLHRIPICTLTPLMRHNRALGLDTPEERDMLS